MRTFNAWWIANFETIINIVLIIIFELYLFQTKTLPGGTDPGSLVIMGPFLIILIRGIFAGGMPAKSIGADIFNLIAMVVVYGCILLYWYSTGKMGYLIWLSSGLCIALVVSATAAIFTCRNMDEVVSRRMLYHNSNADLFGITWQYTFNRFIALFSGISFLTLECIMIYHYL